MPQALSKRESECVVGFVEDGHAPLLALGGIICTFLGSFGFGKLVRGYRPTYRLRFLWVSLPVGDEYCWF